MLKLLKKTRSYRRYDEHKRINYEALCSLVEAVRLSPSAGNLQRIRVAVVNDKNKCEEVFETLSFAAYLSDWKGPSKGERPVAYLVLMTDRDPDANLLIDVGIAAQSVLLTASSLGLGGCFFRSFDSKRLGDILNKPGYQPIMVIALGTPVEQVVIEDMKDCSVKYYRDKNDRHIVPKRSVKDLII